MKINEKREVVELVEIAFGEAFEFKKRIYIKCLDENSTDENCQRTVMDIETGRLVYINVHEIVRPVNAEINIIE